VRKAEHSNTLIL